jgi:hypothetical protein
VGQIVLALCGEQIEEQRARIRDAGSSIPEEAVAPAMGSRSLHGVTVQSFAFSTMSRSTATAISVLGGGITVAGLLGILAVSAIPTRSERSAATAPASAIASARLSESITVIPAPPDAIVEINGVVIGTGKQLFARPKPATKLNVVVRAQNFTSATLTIDHHSNSDLFVALLPAASAPSASVPSSTPPTTDAGPASPSGPHSQPPTGPTRPEKIRAPTIPVNPY